MSPAPRWCAAPITRRTLNPSWIWIEPDLTGQDLRSNSMQKVNLVDVPVEHRRSPGGKYELFRQNVSMELGGIKDIGPWGGGHPFDVELVKVPPGKANFPLHAHAAQTEYYLVISGQGSILGEQAELRLAAGDHVICHPGEAHQITNDG